MSRAERYWQDLGGLPAGSLGEARIQLLHAAAVLGAAADVCILAAPDDAHLRLVFMPDAGALVTRPIDAPDPLRLGLSLCAFELVAIDPDGGMLSSLPLPGSTLAEAIDWTGARARDAGLEDVEVTLPRPLGTPVHPLASIGTFSEDAVDAAREIGKYFADTQLLFEVLIESGTAVGPIDTRPSLLTMVTRIPIATGSGDDDRVVVVGFCPGDEVTDEPFWFLRPSPPPDLRQPPVMAEPGHWRSEGWQGAVMTASELFERTGTQTSVALGFVQRALTLCRGLLS